MPLLVFLFSSIFFFLLSDNECLNYVYSTFTVLAFYFELTLRSKISPHNPCKLNPGRKVQRERHLSATVKKRILKKIKWNEIGKKGKRGRGLSPPCPPIRRPFHRSDSPLSHDHFISHTQIHFPVYQDSDHFLRRLFLLFSICRSQ